MTISADNVMTYMYGDRELVAVPLGHKHYLVLQSGGASCCEVRRFEHGQLQLRGDGRVSLHRLRHLASMVHRQVATGIEAVNRGLIDVHWARHMKEAPKQVTSREYAKYTPHAKLDPLHVDEALMDKLRCEASFTANIESALRLALANAHIDAAAYAYAHGMTRALNEHGIRGVKLNVSYLVNNLKRWSGMPAVAAKKTLMKWARYD